ncbi:transketolase [Roseospira visakhapatnamensis]|uniref:Transketolase n=1 Tax=Roseospira visakhapatnamensis TaxID=390880 RepID=A0A7W6RFA4_9PROT|nr:transketolase [Roseospira visakhapatnamensis]MBB4267476.1 transketolase [Roseospira visakhapatnamensis]
MTPNPTALRAEILRIAHDSGHGHVPTCFSIVEMLCAVYGVMRHDPARPEWDGRDLFVLSKGHASLAHYVVLGALGYYDPGPVARFGNRGTMFGCHADRLKVPGVEVSTGSLGHGIGLATGMALAEKILGTDRRVYTLVGDGESNEGTVWEAVMVAVDRGLDNLTLLYDDNRSQGRALQIPNPAERLAAFGCDTVGVDGHDVAALTQALTRPARGVRAVVARTVKGKGCRTLEDNMYEWHRKSPDAETLAKLLEELHAPAV